MLFVQILTLIAVDGHPWRSSESNEALDARNAQALDAFLGNAAPLWFANLKQRSPQWCAGGSWSMWSQDGEGNIKFEIALSGHVINKVEVSGVRKGLLELGFLPPSAQTICITDCKQKALLCIRSLPRCAKNVDLSLNKLYGRLDLHELPIDMERFSVQSNRFHGVISLTRLPRKLRWLNLYDNRLDGWVWYSDLPTTDGKHIQIVLGMNFIKAKNVMPLEERSRVRTGGVFLQKPTGGTFYGRFRERTAHDGGRDVHRSYAP